MDGRKQRQAVTAAEQAIRALAAGEPERAVAAASRADALDQIGAYRGFVAAIGGAAADLAAGGEVGEQAWDAIAAAVGPGPLAIEVDAVRGA